jgi:peptidoglycan/LPS O-acetylase OafA/YrhL
MINALDGLRAGAVSLVVLSHAGFPLEAKIGVEIFFVISGFLITKNLLQEYKTNGTIILRNFYIRRFSRLYPSLLLVVVVTVIYLLIIEEYKSNYVLSVISMLTFTTDLLIWLNSTEVPIFFNYSWSLGVEEQFYLIWPVVLISILRMRHLRRFFFFMSLCLMFAFSYLWQFTHTGAGHSSESLYFVPFSHLGALAGGCLVALPSSSDFFAIFKKRFPNTFSFIGWSCGLTLVYLSHYASPIPFKIDESSLLLCTLSAIMLVAYLVNYKDSFLSKVIGSRIPVFIGRLSYTLYLFNIIFFYFYKNMMNKSLSESNVIQISFTLSMLIFSCYVIYTFYEMPLRKYINRFQS